MTATDTGIHDDHVSPDQTWRHYDGSVLLVDRIVLDNAGNRVVLCKDVETDMSLHRPLKDFFGKSLLVTNKEPAAADEALIKDSLAGLLIKDAVSTMKLVLNDLDASEPDAAYEKAQAFVDKHRMAVFVEVPSMPDFVFRDEALAKVLKEAASDGGRDSAGNDGTDEFWLTLARATIAFLRRNQKGIFP